MQSSVDLNPYDQSSLWLYTKLVSFTKFPSVNSSMEEVERMFHSLNGYVDILSIKKLYFNKVTATLQSSMFLWTPGDTPSRSLYGEAPSEMGTFFKLKGRVSIAEVCERVKKSALLVSKKAKNGSETHFKDVKDARKCPGLVTYSY